MQRLTFAALTPFRLLLVHEVPALRGGALCGTIEWTGSDIAIRLRPEVISAVVEEPAGSRPASTLGGRPPSVPAQTTLPAHTVLPGFASNPRAAQKDPADAPSQDRQQTAAGASHPASQPAMGVQETSQTPPRSPLRRVQSSPSQPMAAAAAQPTVSACPEAPPVAETLDGQELRPRQTHAGKENRHDSQPTPPEPQRLLPGSLGTADGRPESRAADEQLPQPEAAESAPRRTQGLSQEPQPLESLPSRPSPVTPDAPITVDGSRLQGLGPGFATGGLADPLQLSATVPALPRGLARPQDATAALVTAAPGLLVLQPAPDTVARASVAPTEDSPQTVAGQGPAAAQVGSHTAARQLPANVNRFYMRQAPAPGRTLAGGVTVEAFQRIEPFRWRPSPALAAAHAAAALPAQQPTATTAEANAAQDDLAGGRAEVAAGDEEGPHAGATAEAEDAVSDTQGTSTPSRQLQSPVGADEAAAAGVVPDSAEAAEREPTGLTQTQDEEAEEAPGSPPGCVSKPVGVRGRHAEAEGVDSSPPSPAGSAGAHGAGISETSPDQGVADVGQEPGQPPSAAAAGNVDQDLPPGKATEHAAAAPLEQSDRPAREAAAQAEASGAVRRGVEEANVDCPTDAEVGVRAHAGLAFMPRAYWTGGAFYLLVWCSCLASVAKAHPLVLYALFTLLDPVVTALHNS